MITLNSIKGTVLQTVALPQDAPSDQSHGVHGAGHADESANVGARYVIAGHTEFLSRFKTAGMDINHDLMQAFFRVFKTLGVTGCILLHLQCAGRHAPSIGSLARSIQDPRRLKQANAFRRSRHIRALEDGDTTVAQEQHCIVSVALILCSTGQSQLARDTPYIAAIDIARPRPLIGIVADKTTLDFLDRHVARALTGQGILENLFETKKLDNPEIHRRVKSNPALVGTQCTVELNSEAAIDLNLPAVILPGNTKNNLTLWLADSLNYLLISMKIAEENCNSAIAP